MILKVELPLLVTGAFAATALILLTWKIKGRKRIYVKVGKVAKLFHYPVKSLKAIAVPEIECTNIAVKSGGIWDRTFLLMSDEHVVVSQRQAPQMVLLSVTTCENGVIITSPDGKTLKVNVKDHLNEHDKIVNCKIFTDVVPVVDCGDEAAKFFQNYLGRDDVRLMQFMCELPSRKYIGEFHILSELLPDKLALQDLSPIHLVCQSSLDDLNTRVEKKVTELNFRPNVLIEGGEPYAEDTWTSIKFSSGAVVGKVLPATRCMLTTNDPDTGVKTNKDPVKTLRKYRMLKDEELSRTLCHMPAFGLYGWISEPGKIAVGDDVYAVIEKRTIVKGC